MGYRTTQLFLAAVTTLTCGAIALTAYSRLIAYDEIENALLTDLEFGENHFSFLSADKSCFGNTTLILSEQDNTLHVKVKGWISLQLENQIVTPTLDGDLNLNPLGQIGASLGEISLAGSTIKLGSYNINPITVAVITSEGGVEKKFEQNIPGPFEIKKGRSGKYFLSGPAITRALTTKDSTGFSLANLPISPPTISRDPKNICLEASATPLNISLLSSGLKKFQGQLTKSFSQFLP